MKLITIVLSLLLLNSILSLQYRISSKPTYGFKLSSSLPIESPSSPRKNPIKCVANFLNRIPVWIHYTKSLNLKPIRTKSFSSSFGFLSGELLYQLIFLKAQFLPLRALLMASFGLLYHGPLGHLFYTNLNKKIPTSTTKDVTLKVVIDQVIYTPLLHALMIAHIGVLIGLSPRKILSLEKVFLPQLIIISFMIWPLSHFMNFCIIPPKFRLLFINFVQTLNNLLLSKVTAAIC